MSLHRSLLSKSIWPAITRASQSRYTPYKVPFRTFSQKPGDSGFASNQSSSGAGSDSHQSSSGSGAGAGSDSHQSSSSASSGAGAGVGSDSNQSSSSSSSSSGAGAGDQVATGSNTTKEQEEAADRFFDRYFSFGGSIYYMTASEEKAAEAKRKMLSVGKGVTYDQLREWYSLIIGERNPRNLEIPHLLFHIFPSKETAKYVSPTIGFASMLSIKVIAEGIKVPDRFDWQRFVDFALGLKSPIGGISYEQFVDAYMRNYAKLPKLKVHDQQGNLVTKLKDTPRWRISQPDTWAINISNALYNSYCAYDVLPSNGAGIDSVYTSNKTVYFFQASPQSAAKFDEEHYVAMKKEIEFFYRVMGGEGEISFKYCVLNDNMNAALKDREDVFVIPMDDVFTPTQQEKISKQIGNEFEYERVFGSRASSASASDSDSDS